MSTLSADERLVNLALAFISAKKPLSAQDIFHNSLIGYDQNVSMSAFKRMFARDKDQLAQSGIIIKSLVGDNYELDKNASFASDLELEPLEIASLRAIAYALLEDQDYPYAHELRFALAKLSRQISEPISLDEEAKLLDQDEDFESSKITSSTSKQSFEQKELQEINQAIKTRKLLYFNYTNASGSSSEKEVYPYALFIIKKTWYLIAFDTKKSSIRVFKYERMASIKINSKSPLSPDFDIPDIDTNDYIGLPFMYGEENYEASLSVSLKDSWRIEQITKGKGSLSRTEDALVWTVRVRDTQALCRFIAGSEINICPLQPSYLVKAYQDNLQKVKDIHGTPIQ